MPPKNYKPGDRLSAADVNYAIQGANRVANMRGSSRGNTSISVRDDSVVVDVRPQDLADNTIIFCVGSAGEVPVGPPAVVPRYSVVMVEGEYVERLNFYKRPSADNMELPSLADSHLHGRAGGFVRVYGLGLVAFNETSVPVPPLVAGDYLGTNPDLYYANYYGAGAMQVISTSGAAAAARSTLETRRLTASGWLSLYPGADPFIKLAMVRVGIGAGVGGYFAEALEDMTADSTLYSCTRLTVAGAASIGISAYRPAGVNVVDGTIGVITISDNGSYVFLPAGHFIPPDNAEPAGAILGQTWMIAAGW